MSGEKNLAQLMATLRATLINDTYVFVTLENTALPAGLMPQMMFREAEGITLIVTRSQADAHRLSHTFACRMITLDVHSSLEAVGFMARIATALADEGIAVNPVAGFYHDHLFVPEGREQDALRILYTLAAMDTHGT